MSAAPSLLIVGAGGFIGGFIAAEGLRRGWDVSVGVRASTSRRWLSDPRLKVLEFDYDSPSQVEATLAAAGPWTYIIYNLGATKAANFPDFNRINFQYLRTFGQALKAVDRVPEKFLFMSSLSAVGAVNEASGKPIEETDPVNPNTRYGLSKIKAEQWLETLSGLPWIIFRPTGVYGPHEQDYLMMIRSIDRHFDFGVGFRPQALTFVYVDDLVRAMFLALEKAPTGRRYNIAHPRAYSQKEFRTIAARELGRKFVVPIVLPLWLAKAVCWTAHKLSLFTGKPATLNPDKFKIMRQRNWRCSVNAAAADFDFTAAIDLPEGLHHTVNSYRNK